MPWVPLDTHYVNADAAQGASLPRAAGEVVAELMERYETTTGIVTERVRVEFEPDEAEAFAAAFDVVADVLEDSHPIFRGLRRIATAHAIEQPTIERSTPNVD